MTLPIQVVALLVLFGSTVTASESAWSWCLVGGSPWEGAGRGGARGVPLPVCVELNQASLRPYSPASLVPSYHWEMTDAQRRQGWPRRRGGWLRVGGGLLKK